MARMLIVLCFLLFGVRTLADSPRQDVLLQNDWRFIRDDVPGAEAETFDDSSWQKVSIPHTWNAVDAQSMANYYRGPGWYRKHLTLNGSDIGPLSGKRNYLRFEGVSAVADVFVNGKKLGQHRGAFGAFCFEASDALKPGDNIIAIRADNTKFPDIAPISGDFAIFGGIYRDVHLLTLSDRSIDPLDDASPGVYILQEDVTPERAVVRITTNLRNGTLNPWNATVRSIVRDAGGKEVATGEVRTTAPSWSLRGDWKGNAAQTILIDQPHLWDGHRSTSSPAPYLYTVTIETLANIDGVDTVTDRIVQPLGIRSFTLDPDKGFILNGEHYSLHGANKHQDRKDKGWAISKEDQAEDFDLLLEMGSTGVRLAHYPHSEYSYSLCDKNGLLVWAEIPLVDRVAPTEEFSANAKQQVREMIKQHFNHPSIVVWSISNELWMGRKDNVGAKLPLELYTLAKSLDPSRPIVNADNGPPDYEHNGNTDAIAFNRYYGWYVDKAADWAGIDDLHVKLPHRAVGISEYGGGANPQHHEIDPKMPVHNGPWHPEEYQTLLHESAWNVMKKRDWLWCVFFWNGFDFATPIRQEGGFQSLNDKGVISYDRKIKKDAFYFYKANWSDEPVVYVASRRFSPRPAGVTNVRVYSNQAAVELFVNDKSMGVLKAAEFPDRTFEWKGVELPVGNCRVSAVGMNEVGKPIVKDGFAWMCEAAR
ncbi:MAG: glycoside hydrolase family 2 protein [Phycisphaerales bacterium]